MVSQRRQLHLAKGMPIGSPESWSEVDKTLPAYTAKCFVIFNGRNLWETG